MYDVCRLIDSLLRWDNNTSLGGAGSGMVYVSKYVCIAVRLCAIGCQAHSEMYLMPLIFVGISWQGDLAALLPSATLAG